MKIFICLLIILLLLVLALIFGSWVGFCVAFRRSKRPPRSLSRLMNSPFWASHQEEFKKGTEWVEAQYSEKFTIQSRDGLTLSARYYPQKGATRTLLLFHGYRSSARNDFCPSLRFYFCSLGMNILLVDQRAHGESEGRYICFGAKERFDCADWVREMNRRFGENQTLFLGGVSMGAATVLMAAGQPLPANVRGIVADCGFTSPAEIIRKVMQKDLHLPLFPLFHLLNGWCRAVAGFSMYEASTPEVMQNNHIPVLFIHGTKDDFVPYAMSVQSQQACAAPSRLLRIEGAPHAGSYLVNRARYEESVRRFVENPVGYCREEEAY